MYTVTEVLSRSRQFRHVKMRDRLGREQKTITFDHELVGKFLASRHVSVMLESASRKEALQLATDEVWQDVFFFVIDEAEALLLPELLLDDLIYQGGAISFALVAYAIKSKSGEYPPLPSEIRKKYSDARIDEDAYATLSPHGYASGHDRSQTIAAWRNWVSRRACRFVLLGDDTTFRQAKELTKLSNVTPIRTRDLAEAAAIIAGSVLHVGVMNSLAAVAQGLRHPRLIHDSFLNARPVGSEGFDSLFAPIPTARISAVPPSGSVRGPG